MLTPALHKRERARLWVSSLPRLVAQAHWGKGSFSTRVSSFCSPRRMSFLEGKACMLKWTPAYMGSHLEYIWEKSSLPVRVCLLGKEGKEVLWHWRSLFCTQKRWWNERALMLTLWFYRRRAEELFRFFSLPLWGLYVSIYKTICVYMYVCTYLGQAGAQKGRGKLRKVPDKERRSGVPKIYVLSLLLLPSTSGLTPHKFLQLSIAPSCSCVYPNIYLYHSSS